MAVKLASAGFLIPYIFCYNPGLLMIGASNLEILFFVCTAAIGIAALSFACVGFWMRPLFIWERLILAASAITLITPGLLSDIIGLGFLVLVYCLQKFFRNGPGANAGNENGQTPETA